MAAQQEEQSTDLIYGIDDRPPFKDALFAALQHLLAIFVAIITPPLIIAGSLKLDLETTSFLVSMALFASGISTFVQCRTIGPIGSGLLCIQGTSFSFIGPIITTGLIGGLPLVFGTCMAGTGRDDSEQGVQVYAFGHYALGVGHRRPDDRLVPDKSRYRIVRRRLCGDG